MKTSLSLSPLSLSECVRACMRACVTKPIFSTPMIVRIYPISVHISTIRGPSSYNEPSVFGCQLPAIPIIYKLLQLTGQLQRLAVIRPLALRIEDVNGFVSFRPIRDSYLDYLLPLHMSSSSVVIRALFSYRE